MRRMSAMKSKALLLVLAAFLLVSGGMVQEAKAIPVYETINIGYAQVIPTTYDLGNGDYYLNLCVNNLSTESPNDFERIWKAEFTSSVLTGMTGAPAKWQKTSNEGVYTALTVNSSFDIIANQSGSFGFSGSGPGADLGIILYDRAGDKYSGTLVNTQPVPGPATILLLGSGLAGVAGFRRRNLKK